MRILLLTQWYPPEPAKLLADLAQSFQAAGHEVTVLTAFPNYPIGKLYPGYRMRTWQRETIDGVSVIRVPLYPDHGRSKVRRAMNYLTFAVSASFLGRCLAPRVDVIHAYCPPVTIGWPAWLLSRSFGVPFTMEIQDLWPETLEATGMLRGRRILTWIGRFANWVYRRAAAIRVISPGVRANLIGKGVPAHKVHVISNWVDTEVYRPTEPSARLAGEAGLAGRFNVMYAGNIGLAQGMDTVLDAAAAVADLAEVQFVLVGDGADLERIKRCVRDRGLANVIFLGQRATDEMPAFYALADVLLVPLRDDPLFRITIPHKVFAYMASGKPILAAVNGNAADTVRSSGAGLTCAPGRRGRWRPKSAGSTRCRLTSAAGWAKTAVAPRWNVSAANA